MTSPVDVVLGYHLNPLTCGVAKFNRTLAGRLGVPVVNLFAAPAAGARRPLLSIKVSEFRPDDLSGLRRLVAAPPWPDGFLLFLHDWTDTDVERMLAAKAAVVYSGNAELTAAVRPLRPDLVAAWCPGTMLQAERFPPAPLSVFSFGMAHKVRADYHRRLRELLEATEESYCVYLSTALHEDTTFDGSFAGAYDELREIYGPRLYFLGYLSDTAVYNYLVGSTFFAAFFDRGVRANNTTVHAAMSCGAVVITNLDEYSPPAFAHLDNVIDIRRCDALPTRAERLEHLGRRALATAAGPLGWDALVETMRGPGASSGPSPA